MQIGIDTAGAWVWFNQQPSLEDEWLVAVLNKTASLQFFDVRNGRTQNFTVNGGVRLAQGQLFTEQTGQLARQIAGQARGDHEMHAVGTALPGQSRECIQIGGNVVLAAAKQLNKFGKIVDAQQNHRQWFGWMQRVVLVDIFHAMLVEQQLARLDQMGQLAQQVCHPLLKSFFIGHDDRTHLRQFVQCCQVAPAQIQQVDVQGVGGMGSCQTGHQRAQQNGFAPAGRAKQYSVTTPQVNHQRLLLRFIRIVYQPHNRAHDGAAPIKCGPLGTAV